MTLRAGARRALIAVLIVAGVFGQILVLLVPPALWHLVFPSCPHASLPSVSMPAPTTRLPADRVVFDSNRSGSYEIYTMTTAGSAVTRVTHDPASDSWWPQLSPDRKHIVFYRTPAGTYDKNYHQASLWIMDVDGSHVEQLLPVGAYGWGIQGHAEWSPDGARLTMFGGCGSSPQIYVTDALGRNPRQVTHRSGSNLDPSWSPDGKQIAFVGCPSGFCLPGDLEVYRIPSAGGTPIRVTHDDLRDNDPAFSPNGRWIAWLSETSSAGIAGTWNIRIAHPDGSDLRLVTDDHNINSRPVWAPDGRTIYFHRLVYDAPHPHFGIWAIRPDGMGLRDLTAGQPGADGYPSA